MSERQVVVRHHGTRRRRAGPRSLRVIARQRQINQVGEVPFPFVVLQVIEEEPRPVNVRNQEGKPWVARMSIGLQRFEIRFDGELHRGGAVQIILVDVGPGSAFGEVRLFPDELAVVAERLPVCQRVVP